MARAKVLSISPDLDLQKGMAQIEAERAAQTQGAQKFGTDMDARLQGIYGQLTGSLQQGVGATQNIYNKSQEQIRGAYEGSGNFNAAGSQQVQSQLAGMAQQLGLDPAALAEVSGRLGQQAATFQMRNQQSMADRVATQAQLGAGMSSVSQFAVNAAQQAMAQGRQDLARRVATEIQRANTMAAAARSDFTTVKANQAARAAAAAEAEARRAMAELAREQRANQRAAAAEARANAREARRAAREGGGRKWDPFELFLAKEQWKASQQQPDPHDVIWNDMMAQNFGPKATGYIESRLAGKTGKDIPKEYRTGGMNIPLLESYAIRLKGARKR